MGSRLETSIVSPELTSISEPSPFSLCLPELSSISEPRCIMYQEIMPAANEFRLKNYI